MMKNIYQLIMNRTFKYNHRIKKEFDKINNNIHSLTMNQTIENIHSDIIKYPNVGQYEYHNYSYVPKHYMNTYNRNYTNKYKFGKHNINKNDKYTAGGIIPWTIKDGQLLFLMQRTIKYCDNNTVRDIDNNGIDNIFISKRHRNNYSTGWVDFGGKINPNENILDTVTREFSEETSGITYLLSTAYGKKNPNLLYNTLSKYEWNFDNLEHLQLMELIDESSNHYKKIIMQRPEMYFRSKNGYICYFVPIEYIDASLLFPSEDIHIAYDNRYIRECKWLTYDELRNMGSNKHKRLVYTNMNLILDELSSKNKFNTIE